MCATIALLVLDCSLTSAYLRAQHHHDREPYRVAADLLPTSLPRGSWCLSALPATNQLNERAMQVLVSILAKLSNAEPALSHSFSLCYMLALVLKQTPHKIDSVCRA